MRALSAKTVSKKLISVISPIGLMLLMAHFILGQQRRPSPPPRINPVKVVRERQARTIERESLLNESKKRSDDELAPLDQRTFKQASEDFVRLQVLNNQLTEAVSSTAIALDYKLIANKAAEINKRANRLRGNLVLPKLEDGGKRPQKNESAPESGQIKTLLLTLNDRIKSFVSNPYFQSPGVIDIKQQTAARLDLESIIELSRSIRKSAEKLSHSYPIP
jgi:hypothetical protein